MSPHTHSGWLEGYISAWGSRERVSRGRLQWGWLLRETPKPIGVIMLRISEISTRLSRSTGKQAARQREKNIYM